MFRVSYTRWLPLLFCLILFFLLSFWVVPVMVKGDSMVPTLLENQRLLVVKHGHFSRFDLVVFTDPKSNKPLIKRVIGLPGERIRYEGDQLFIEGEKIDEPFLESLRTTLAKNSLLTENISEQTIPADTYFVLGDNRKISRDSRMFGVVKEEEIIGEAKFSYWPLNQIEKLP